MKKGDMVKLKNPLNDAERGALYLLLDDPSMYEDAPADVPRTVDIQLFGTGLPFPPVDRVGILEIEVADTHIIENR
ncbi:MAG: hypothetical protein L0226_15225 [Acidobacteria bacterium]|nr:hypothetical protein [Acidobacteriota bacterium]MCI0591006.1 hypothetical protein [Gammaproteobacteria bacterium]